MQSAAADADDRIMRENPQAEPPDGGARFLEGWLPALAVLAFGAVVVQGLMAGIVIAFAAAGNGIGDWVPFYAAGRIVDNGGGAHLYEEAAQLAVQRELFGGDAVLNFFPLPAFAAYAFVPFSRLTFAQSYLVWLGVNVALLAMLLAGAWRWLSEVDLNTRVAFVGGAALAAPTMTVLLLGQVDFFVIAGMALCWALVGRERPVAGGAALALALVKPHLAASAVLMLLVTRQWRALAGFAAVGAPLLIVPTLLLGDGAFADQIGALASYPGGTTEQRINAGVMVNVRGAVVSITGVSSPWLWGPPLVIIAAAAVVLAVRAWRDERTSPAQAWALVFALPLLYSPHLHMQSVVLLIAAAGCYIAADASSGARRVRPEHLLMAFSLLCAFWILAMSAVSLLFAPIIAAYAVMARDWPQPKAAQASEEELALAS